jgi:uncharacterized protein
MHKFYLLIALCSGCLCTSAQPGYEPVSEKFFMFYNQQLPDSIFNLYAPSLKEKLPLPKTEAVITGLHVQYGDLKSLHLLKQDSGFCVYKAGFSHQTLTLLLALDSNQLIEGYRLVPYSKEQYPDNAIQQ